MRSLLFAPADSPRKLEKAAGSCADCVIIDCEDSVSPDNKAAGRAGARAFLQDMAGRSDRPRLYVRVNALDSGLVEDDLDAVMAAAPDGVMLPKAIGGADVQALSVKIAVREAEFGLPEGSVRIIAIATETAAAVFGLGTYRGASRRLEGLTWGAEDLSAEIGALATRMPDGAYCPPYALVRSLALFGAVAAEAMPIDTVYPNFRDAAGFRADCEAARRDGFLAKMAIHPDQVGPINEILDPSEQAVAKARAIVAAFAANPGAGVLGVGGEMLDRPHLRRAERLLARLPPQRLSVTT